jgi:thiosulfate/3-mercaptopyruvate sulfurtransferase
MRMNSLERDKKQVPWQLIFLLMGLLVFSITVNSCSTSSYNTPITTQTSSTLIDPATLKTWIDSGIVNSTGFDRVVILDVTSLGTYTAGHIPGAQFVNSGDINQMRQEGPAVDVNMNIDGPHMDALIQKYGIDQNTTIVFTSGGSTPSASSALNATRAYWEFRYWGFTKEKLKLLDGINFSWAATYGLTQDIPPSPVPSTYSVKNNVALRTDLRASLNDMINVAEGRVANGVPIDMRSVPTDGSYAGKRGSTAGVFNPSGDFTVFEGRMKGAKAVLYTDMFDSANNYRFKSPDALAAIFMAAGVDSTKLSHVY